MSMVHLDLTIPANLFVYSPFEDCRQSPVEVCTCNNSLALLALY